MNREIKFRGKRTYSGEWVYGHYTQNANTHHYITNPDGSVWQIDPDTIGQFIELYDKNGKEIYEGDKFQVARNKTYTIKFRAESENNFEKAYACFCLESDDAVFPIDEWAINHGEIIGNIHDNPELL